MKSHNLGRPAVFVFGLLAAIAPAQADFVSASGGDATNVVGNYRIHLFTNSATAGSFVVASGGNVELLLVAGGGGGGFNVGGGGGAGGLIYSNVFPVIASSYAVSVGAGGAGSTNGVSVQNGGNTAFGALVAIGGGGGGDAGGRTGGSGGGGYGHITPGNPGAGTPGQGNNGGAKGVANTALTGSGGGGAAGEGAAGVSNVAGYTEGGAGLAFSISGVPTIYAAGGRGSGNNWTGMADAAPGTGNGGDGGGSPPTGKNGASGIVVVRYLVPLSVEARPATWIGLTNATVNGAVISTADAENPTVYFCWGYTNAGANSPDDWLHADFQGADWGPGQPFSTNLTGLLAGSSYVYRCFVSNSTGTAWSDPQSFKAGVAWYAAPTNIGTTNGLAWPTAFTHLQEALDVAGTGDTIYIKGGLYAVTNSLVWSHSGVTILGAYEGTNESGPGAYDTARWPSILGRPGPASSSAAYTNRILTISGVNGGLISRLSLTNGYLNTARAATGGCVYVTGATNLTLSSLTIAGGYVYSLQPLVAGAGLYLADASNVTLAVCVIRDNTGGCVNNDSIRGSGIFATNSWITITNCIIKNNSGGNYVSTGADHGVLGGGLYLGNCQANVIDTSILGNYSLGHSAGTGLGAGVFAAGGTNLFRNCLIAGNDNRINANSTDNSFRGDGAYIRGGVSTFANCTFVRNNGEGLFFSSGTVTITNCILWDNLDDLVNIPTNSAGGLSQVWRSCIEDGDNAGTNGCLSADPLFERGLYLAMNSPCVDAGVVDAGVAGVAGLTTRADGAPDSGAVDLGYHFASGILNTPLADLYVDPAGADTNSGTDSANAFRSVTRALSQVIHGSRIHIASGLYTNKTESFPLAVNSIYGLELLGTNAAATVIRATGAGQAALFFRGVGYARIEGVGVTGGSGSGSYPSGGGVSLVASRLTIGSCIISNNVMGAPGLGAGLWMKNTFLLMTNCLVTRNTMTVPGGSCSWGHGGGIFVQNGELTLLDSSVISNSAASKGISYGGGIYMGGNYGASGHLISNCVVAGNSTAVSGGTAARGGGLYLMATAGFVNCIVATNVAATNGVSAGGGVFVDSGSVGMRNEIVFGSGSGSVRRCTVAGNGPEGIRQNTTGDCLAIRDSILWNNGDDLVSSNMTAALGSLWYSDIGNGDNNGTNGCISADPLFANPANDWHLKSHGGRWTPGGVWVKDPVTSPCIDAGDPAAGYALEPEPNGRRVNMGAYGNTAQASLKSLMRGVVITVR